MIDGEAERKEKWERITKGERIGKGEEKTAVRFDAGVELESC